MGTIFQADLTDKEFDDNEQETSETKTEVFKLKTEVFAYASRSKAKAKPRRPSTTCSSTKTAPIFERKWIVIEPGAQFDQAYPVAKKLKTLFFGTENYPENKTVRSNSGDHHLKLQRMDAMSAADLVGGAAWRRRQRQLRAFHRHVQMAVKLELSTALHHSAQRVEAPREEVELEKNVGPRAQKPPLQEKRPAPLEEVSEPQAKLGQHGGIGHELVLALDVPVLQMVEQPVDASALAFLVEAERTREAVRRGQVLSQKGRGRKEIRRKRKLPKGSSPRSLPARAVRTRKSGPLSCGSSCCSVFGCCTSSPGFLDFWEMASTMFPYSTLSLVRRWIHAHASVYETFERFLWHLAVACSTLSLPEEYRDAFFSGR